MAIFMLPRDILNFILKRLRRPQLLAFAFIKGFRDLPAFANRKPSLRRCLYKLIPTVSSLCYLRWLHDTLKMPQDPSILHLIVSGGHLDLLRWVRQHWFPPQPSTRGSDIRACIEAATLGHLEMLRHLTDDGADRRLLSASLYGVAANNNRLEVCQWLKAKGVDWSDTVLNGAARHGHLALVRWAYDNGYSRVESGAELTASAAASGKVDLLDFLVSKNVEVTCSAMEVAAKFGHLAVIDYVAGKQIPITATAVNHAASHSPTTLKYVLNLYRTPDVFADLMTLFFLVPSGRPIPPGCVLSAAYSGHLESLVWLQAAHSIQPNEACALNAAVQNHPKCLTWILKQVTLNDVQFDSLLLATAGATHIACMEALHLIKNCILPHIVAAACASGAIHFVEWFTAHGASFTEECMIQTLRAKKPMPLLKYLKERGAPWSLAVSERAWQNGHRDCFNWMKQNGCPTNEHPEDA